MTCLYVAMYATFWEILKRKGKIIASILASSSFGEGMN